MVLTLTGSYKRSLYHRLIFKNQTINACSFDLSLALLNPTFPPSFGGSFYSQGDECTL